MTKGEALKLKVGDILEVPNFEQFYVEKYSRIEGFSYKSYSEIIQKCSDISEASGDSDDFGVLLKVNKPIELLLDKFKNFKYYTLYKDILSEGLIPYHYSLVKLHKASIDRLELINLINNHRNKFGQNKLDAHNWLDYDLEIECKRLGIL